MGTKYVRDGELLTSINVRANKIEIISVPHIYSLYPIGNTLAIDVRQAPEAGPLVFVSLTRLSDEVLVEIDATGVPAGSYALTLESFDANSSVKSTLKTDVINIYISQVDEDLLFYELTVGSVKTWQLEIDEQLRAMAFDVSVQFSNGLGSYIDFDKDALVFQYNG